MTTSNADASSEAEHVSEGVDMHNGNLDQLQQTSHAQSESP